MKNNEENIDKFIREQLNDRQFDGPPQDFLDDLNDRLDKKGKDGFFGPWNGILDLFILLLLFSWPFFNSAEHERSYTQNDMQSEYLASSNKENRTETFNDTANSGSSKNTIKKVEENAVDKKDNSLPATNVTSGGKDESSKKQETADPYPHTKSSSTNDAESQHNENESNSTFGKERTHQDTNTQAGSKNKSDGDNKASNTSQEQPKQNDNGGLNIPYSPVYASQFHLVEPKIRKWNFPTLPTSNFDLSNSTNTASANTIKQSNLNWEIQVSSGLLLGQTVGNTSSASEDILNAQSTIAPSFTFGGRVSIWLNRSVFTTGLDVVQFKEENLFEINSIESYDSVYVSSVDTTVTFDSTNQSFDTTYTYNYDSTTVTDTVTNSTPVNQQYSWIQIPFQYGYRFTINKWAIIPRVGGNLAVGIRQTDKLYPSAQFDELQNYPIESKLLLNLTGSLEIRRDFNNIHLFVRGDYQTGMRPILTGDYFERRFGAFRFNVGVGITL